jgi:hypothetical protein
MSTYATIHTELTGSAKGPGQAWFRLTDATVYFDHPAHAMAEHTLNIDLPAPALRWSSPRRPHVTSWPRSRPPWTARRRR